MSLQDPSKATAARRAFALTTLFASLFVAFSMPILAEDPVRAEEPLQPDIREANPAGGCCMPDGTCTIKSMSECLDDGGVFLSSDDPCDLPCAGACCLPL